MQAAERASFGGFFGETWTRLVSDDFHKDPAPAASPQPLLRPAPAA